MLAMQEYAMDLLTASHQTTLPIDENAVARWLGAKVQPYSAAKPLLTTLGCWEYAGTVKGLSVRIDGAVCICYPDRLSALERRSVILHECGHIYLKHLTDSVVLGKSGDPDVDAAQEQEADAFALFALAPPELLSRMKVFTAREIARTCRVSLRDARTVAAFMRPEAKRKTLHWFLAAVLATLAVFLLILARPTETPPARPLPTKRGATVYVTPAGDRYHRQDCYHIAGHDVIAIDRAAAINSGYTPCKTCRPD